MEKVTIKKRVIEQSSYGSTVKAQDTAAGHADKHNRDY